VAGKRLKGLTQLDITAQPNSRSRAEAKLRDYLIIRVDNITQPHGEELLSSVAREILFFELQVGRSGKPVVVGKLRARVGNCVMEATILR
jgi:hypothetical protein